MTSRRRGSALLVLVFAGPACVTLNIHERVAARPTEHFPVTWDGAQTAPVAPATYEPAPPPMPAPVRAEPAPAAPAQPVAAAAAPRPPPPKTGESGVVAVMPVNAKEAHLDSATLLAFEEAIRTVTADVLTPGGYTVLTGETTLAILTDNGVDLTKACEAACALSAARELKARLFVSATIAQTEGTFVAFIRLFENGRGRQLGSVQLEAPTVRELRKAFAAQAPDFFAKALAGAD